MQLAVIEVFGVEWVGGKKPALEQVGPLLGSLLVAGVAAFAAWLAAHTANKRQRNQLDYESKRHREQLEHDTTRQREQLRHDRAMRDREHLRTVLETVLKSLSRTIEDVVALSASLEALEKATTELREAPDEMKNEVRGRKLEILDEVVERIEAAGSAIGATVLDGVRLRLFLSLEDPIVKSYLELSEALREWRSTFPMRRKDGDLQLRDEVELARSGEAREKCDGLLNEFQKVCQSRFAVKPLEQK